MSEEMKNEWVEPTASEVVDLLATGREGVLKFNAMRIENPDWTPVLDNWMLYKLDLTGVNFSGALLNFCDLRDTNLSNANLFDTELCAAILSGANLSGANLTRADLDKANLRGAILNGANLYMAKGLRRLDWQAFSRLLEASIEFAD
jgi:uncharacterized protein YjbI with pentapeptide repeats